MIPDLQVASPSVLGAKVDGCFDVNPVLFDHLTNHIPNISELLLVKVLIIKLSHHKFAFQLHLITFEISKAVKVLSFLSTNFSIFLIID